MTFLRRRQFLWGWVALALVVACDDAPAPARDAGPADLGAEVGGAVDAGDAADGAAGSDAEATPPEAAPEAGPPDHPSDADAGGPPADASVDAPQGAPREVDILFLIDDSGSMREEQEALASAFPAFISALEALPGGLPSLHIGVVSSDVGAGNGLLNGQPVPTPEGCRVGGDRGELQVRPECGLAGADRFLRVDAAGARNVTAPLPEVFGCMATLGTSGCGYEHHLQALRFAFDPTINPHQRRDFLRPNAELLVVILADEDDCSGDPTSAIYPFQLPGQAGSLRCSLLGHVCGGQPVPAMDGFRAPLSSCAPYERQPAEIDQRLINVSEFVASMKALKPERPDAVMVSVIIGWDDGPNATYGILTRPRVGGGTELDTLSICQSPATGVANPGLRLRAFAQAFARHTVHSICASDLTPAMRAIAAKLGPPS